MISLQYLDENVKDVVDFSLLLIAKHFFKVILSFLMCVTRHYPGITKTKTLLFLCNILKEKWMTKLMFCMQVSMKTYYKLILWFWRRWSSISKVPKMASLHCLYNILKKEVRDEAEFLHAHKYQSCLQTDFNTLGTKVGYKVILWLLIRMMKHSQITQSNNFANLCNISKKLGMEFTFCMLINTKVSKIWYYHFWWKQTGN